MPEPEPAIAAELAKALRAVGRVTALEDYRARLPDLTTRQRHALLDQATIVLRDVYVHLPIKRALHAVDPLQSLQVLRRRAGHMDARDFHHELLAIFKSLRDVHTGYALPAPFAGAIAFLPFLLEDYTQAGRRRFVVSRVLAGYEHASFGPGAEITRWSGVPMDLAVARNADREDGSNPAARLALGVQYMTVRWLGASLPPDESWVMVGYRKDGRARSHHELRLPWLVLELADHAELKVAAQALWTLEQAASETAAENDCLNVRSRLEHVSRKLLFAGHGTKRPKSPPRPIASRLAQCFEASALTQRGREYGHIRIRAFAGPRPQAFVNEFRRLLRQMPRDGLVLDVRGNPGGTLQSGERLLQLLTPREIAPAPFHFIASPLTSRLTNPPHGLPDWAGIPRRFLQRRWGASTKLALEMGAAFSGGVPLTSPRVANAVGQEYFGPVALIVDALSYSSADIFAAGFQDHAIGPVIGVDASTGAGGANLWAHHQLLNVFPDAPELRALPRGATLHFAVRRCTRVGPHAGMPIEEIGVRPDVRYHLTREDVLGRNEKLLATAMRKLAKMPRRSLQLRARRTGRALALTARVQGIDRLDFFVSGRPWDSKDVRPGRPVTVRLRTPSARRCVLELHGYARGALVARSRHLV